MLFVVKCSCNRAEMMRVYLCTNTAHTQKNIPYLTFSPSASYLLTLSYPRTRTHVIYIDAVQGRNNERLFICSALQAVIAVLGQTRPHDLSAAAPRGSACISIGFGTHGTQDATSSAFVRKIKLRSMHISCRWMENQLYFLKLSWTDCLLWL